MLDIFDNSIHPGNHDCCVGLESTICQKKLSHIFLTTKDWNRTFLFYGDSLFIFAEELGSSNMPKGTISRQLQFVDILNRLD